MRGFDFLRSLPPGGDHTPVEAREEKVLDGVRRRISLPISWEANAA